ncbi:JmjC domain-containing histone demethylation protein 1, partial [Spiromyces aspiralis]
VFYHVLSGEKIFYFIPPTPTNMRKYEKWCKSPDQHSTFFGDEVRHCYKAVVKPGNTMFIPAGWIHAVYTPKDAVVVGGNYLMLSTFDKHLQVYDIEARCKVPERYQLPHFLELCWRVGTSGVRAYSYTLLPTLGNRETWSDEELFALYSLGEFIERNIGSFSEKLPSVDVLSNASVIATSAAANTTGAGGTASIATGSEGHTVLDQAQKLSTLTIMELNRRQKLPDNEKKPHFEGKMPKMETRRNSAKALSRKASKGNSQPKIKPIKMRLKALVKARMTRQVEEPLQQGTLDDTTNKEKAGSDLDNGGKSSRVAVKEDESDEGDYLGMGDYDKPLSLLTDKSDASSASEVLGLDCANTDANAGNASDELDSRSISSKASNSSSEMYSASSDENDENGSDDEDDDKKDLEYDDSNRRRRVPGNLLSRRIRKRAKPDLKVFMNIGSAESPQRASSSPKDKQSTSAKKRIMQRLKMKI